LAHLRVRYGRCALVSRTLLLVATGNVDHGRCVDSSTRAGADTDTDTGATHRLGRAGVTTNRCAVTSRGRRSRCRIVGLRRTIIKARAWLDGDSWVHHAHERANGRRWVAVQVRHRSVDIKLQLVDQVGRDVCLRKGGHVSKLLRGVIRHQGVHLDVLRVNA